MESTDKSELETYTYKHDGSGSDKIDEVYPRIFMSGVFPTANLETLKKLKITHVVSITGAKELLKSSGIKYLSLKGIRDDDKQDIL